MNPELALPGSTLKLSRQAILDGDRRSIAKAITLLESTKTELLEEGQLLLESLLPHTGNSIRIGITGIPGVGKSTFIESLGLELIEKGNRVAVLAVDPSSPITGGSILGDKTRMNELSRHPQAFIRPSPTSGMLGGVSRKTRETLLLCEAAGFDVVFVETVGVGQSETMVASMVDLFVLMLVANAGDELQGLKRGVLEMADLVLINKADGPQKDHARRTRGEYQKALRFFGSNDERYIPPVLLCSALFKNGLNQVWKAVCERRTLLEQSGLWKQKRSAQAKEWMWTLFNEELHNRFLNHSGMKDLIAEIEESVESGALLPTRGAAMLAKKWLDSIS